MDGDPHQHDAVVAEFCALTSASALVAENYLSAHDWDLNRSLDFFYEHPPEGDGANHAAVPDSPPAVASAGVQAVPEGAGAAYGGYDSGTAAAAGPAHPAWAGEDEDLERALAASLGQDQHSAGASAPPLQQQGPIAVYDDEEDEDVAALAQQRQRALEARRAMERDMEGHMADEMAGPSEELFSVRGRGFRGAGAGSSYPAPSFPSGGEPRLPSMFMDEPVPYLNGAAGPSGQGAGMGGLHGAPSLDLPDGINVEEARMLEAAMLGIPYQGRMPDFAREAAEREAREAAGLEAVDPNVAEQRLLVSEQDAAYEESLALDRAKQDSIAQAEREAAAEAQRLKEEARAQREAAVAAKWQAEEAAAAVARLLERKRASLPAEPPAAEPGSLQVMVRMPDGGRKARRFRGSDPLQAAFDFVDVSGDGSQAPGSYRLVMQFPRRAFEDGSSGSFADAGITNDSAFFMEQLTS